jgi:hypothetical protein
MTKEEVIEILRITTGLRESRNGRFFYPENYCVSSLEYACPQYLPKKYTHGWEICKKTFFYSGIKTRKVKYYPTKVF